MLYYALDSHRIPHFAETPEKARCKAREANATY